jgi:hypothetical protein
MKQNRINKFQTEYRRKPHSLLHLNKEAIKLDSCSFSCPAQKASIPFFGTDLVNRDDFYSIEKIRIRHGGKLDLPIGDQKTVTVFARESSIGATNLKRTS